MQLVFEKSNVCDGRVFQYANILSSYNNFKIYKPLFSIFMNQV